MADKVLWNTGDTITADKLNGSGVYMVPIEVDTGTDVLTSNATAKQFVDALEAGAYPVAVIHTSDEGDDWQMNILTRARYSLTNAPSNVTVVFGGDIEMTAEYPDGTFSTGEMPK